MQAGAWEDKIIIWSCLIINVSINTIKMTIALVVKLVDTKDLKYLSEKYLNTIKEVINIVD